jgi:hypothetical protein
VHTPGETPLTDDQGIGLMNNQPYAGLLENATEAVQSSGLLGAPTSPSSVAADGASRPFIREENEENNDDCVHELNTSRS